jgi:hypothetical protein
MENYLNALDGLIKQGNNINNELDKCIDLQEQTIKEIQRTNKILDGLNIA